MNNEEQKIKKALINLYLQIKNSYIKDVKYIFIIQKLQKERKENLDEKKLEYDNLEKQNLMTLIEYIKSSFDIAISINSEKKFLELYNNYEKKAPEFYANDYEKLLRKEESDLREQIGIQNQLKLYTQSLKEKIEYFIEENERLKIKLVIFIFIIIQDNLQKIEEKVMKYKNKLDTLKLKIKQLEEMNSNLTENENKLKLLLTEKDKEIKNIETKLYRKHNNSIGNINGTYSNLLNINFNNINSLNSNSIYSTISKDISLKKINLNKNYPFQIERFPDKEKLFKYIKKKDNTRNKEHNKSFREKSYYKSRELSYEKSVKHNISCVNVFNGNLEKKENKEERKNKTPKKILINNKHHNLCEIIRNNKNKILITKPLIKDNLNINIKENRNNNNNP